MATLEGTQHARVRGKGTVSEVEPFLTNQCIAAWKNMSRSHR